MRSYRSTCAALFALCVVLAVPATPARAAQSYDNCTNFVSSVPATITSQGTWCFNKDLSTSITTGAAITINANNVILDCNDFKLGGLAAGIDTQTVGIASSNRNNLTIRNCNVRGFIKGIQIGSGNTSGHLVENNRIDNTTWVGMDIVGQGSTVRNNSVLNTGGTTIPGNNFKAVGIYAMGDVEIADNLVSGVYAAAGTNGYAVGINPGANLAGSVLRNNVKNVLADGSGWSYGVSFFSGTGRVTVADNNFIGVATANSTPAWCPDDNNVLLARNVFSGWGEGPWACVHDSANITIP